MFSREDAQNAANILKIQFVNFSIEDLLFGMNEELVHGLNYKDTNITNDNPILTAKIALAHLNIFPNYYNKEYGYPHFEETLKLKLAEEEKVVFPPKDDVENKEC